MKCKGVKNQVLTKIDDWLRTDIDNICKKIKLKNNGESRFAFESKRD